MVLSLPRLAAGGANTTLPGHRAPNAAAEDPQGIFDI
jgi:hypothetical protein